jgi:two-component system OmpR family response regulator
MRILIVEDEDAIAEGLKFNFELEGYDVLLARDGPAALRLFQAADPPVDCIVLDLMLPGMSGYEVCTAIRDRDRLVPILVLSARTLSEDKMHAFDCGTDQYMTKPFALPELINRVKNLLERQRTLLQSQRPEADARPPDIRRFDHVTVNFTTYEVTVGERTHNLTTLEMQLLKYFLEHEGQVLSRHEILEKVWDPEAEVTTRTIDNFVLRLRKILEPDPARPKYILSVRGTGYRFVTPEKR